jgi:hypothetical protein
MTDNPVMLTISLEVNQARTLLRFLLRVLEANIEGAFGKPDEVNQRIRGG